MDTIWSQRFFKVNSSPRAWRLDAVPVRRAVATAFKEIGKVEEKHEERVKKLADRLEAGKLFKSDDPKAEWKCLNCGYILKGKDAPDICPACAKPQAYYMQLNSVR